MIIPISNEPKNVSDRVSHAIFELKYSAPTMMIKIEKIFPRSIPLPIPPYEFPIFKIKRVCLR